MQALEKAGLLVTILEPKDFAWVSFAAFRASSAADGESWSKRMTVPLTRVLKRGRVVRGSATGVDTARKVVLYTPHGESAAAELPYDYLVVATGATFAAPFNPRSNDAVAARAALAALRATVSASSRVVVVGGGPSGIELAGEIRDAVPKAAITIVHSGKTLLSGAGNVSPPAALSDKLVERLTANKITTRLATRVASVTGGAPHAAMGESVVTGPLSVVLESGEAIEADLLIYAIGAKPNTAWLSASPLSAALSKSGHVNIERSYAVPGFPGVFALGDAAAGLDAKAAWLLPNAGAIVAKNINALARAKEGQTPKLTLGPETGFRGILAVPIGKKDGAGLLPFGVVGPFLIRNIKGGDLFVTKVSKDWGYSTKELLQQ